MSYNRYDNRDNRGRGYYNRNHVNEKDVPESKHAIFVRGLPGHFQSDDIRDYVQDRIGKCAFDFVKISPDKTRLFVAIRFESRDEAKDFMDKYSSADFMGYECQLSWFKDIRRYAAYQQKQEIDRRRSRDGYSSKRRYSDSDRSKSRSCSRTRSPPSRRDSSGSRSRSRSPKSKEKDVKLFRNKNEDKMDISSDEDYDKAKVEKKKKKKKRRRYSSSDGEIRSDDERENMKAKRHVNNMSPVSDRSASPEQKVKMSDSPSCFIPPPSIAESIDSNSSASKEIKIFLAKPKEEPVFNTKYTMGINSDEPPKPVKAAEEIAAPPAPVPPVAHQLDLPPPPKPPPVTIKSTVPSKGFVPISQIYEEPHHQKTSIWERVAAPIKTEQKMSNGVNHANLPLSAKFFGHLAEYQSEVVEKVKSVPKEEEETFGSLKLSSIVAEEEKPNDEEKFIEREQRLGKLQGLALDKFLVKKKQFEAAFKNDCETYAIVTNKILSKDESLESSLRVALLENVEDLYKQFLDRVDQYLTSAGV